MHKDPYEIIKSRYITEKASMLGALCTSKSNPSVSRCKTPKYVFLVDPRATKCEIASAVEEIYADRNVNVIAVNTINVKSKPRRVRGREGHTASRKKAIVTLKDGDRLEDGK